MVGCMAAACISGGELGWLEMGEVELTNPNCHTCVCWCGRVRVCSHSGRLWRERCVRRSGISSNGEGL